MSLRRVKEGQFIYSRLFAFEGAYGMVTKEFDGAFVSQEYPTFKCDPNPCGTGGAYSGRQLAGNGLTPHPPRLVQIANALADRAIAWQFRERPIVRE